MYNSVNSICQSTSFCRDLLNDTVKNRKDDKTVHCILFVVDWFSHCILSQKLKEIDLKEKMSKTLTECCVQSIRLRNTFYFIRKKV